MPLKRLLCIVAILGGPLTGCQPGHSWSRPAPTGHKTHVTKAHVQEAIEHEKAFAQYYDVPAPAGENWFAIDVGPTPVLVVAGHATAQTRNGTRKAADRGTGSLAVMLHNLTGATAIYTVYESPSDPNFSDDNAFKATLSKLLQELQPALVLDLHTSHADRPYAVDFGTMEGKALLEREELLTGLEEALRGEGLHDLSRDYFPGQHHHTVTKWVAQQGVPCIQLEINSTWLLRATDQSAEHPRFAALLQGLANFLQRFALPGPVNESAFRTVPVANEARRAGPSGRTVLALSVPQNEPIPRKPLPVDPGVVALQPLFGPGDPNAAGRAPTKPRMPHRVENFLLREILLRHAVAHEEAARQQLALRGSGQPAILDGAVHKDRRFERGHHQQRDAAGIRQLPKRFQHPAPDALAGGGDDVQADRHIPGRHRRVIDPAQVGLEPPYVGGAVAAAFRVPQHIQGKIGSVDGLEPAPVGPDKRPDSATQIEQGGL